MWNRLWRYSSAITGAIWSREPAMRSRLICLGFNMQLLLKPQNQQLHCLGKVLFAFHPECCCALIATFYDFSVLKCRLVPCFFQFQLFVLFCIALRFGYQVISLQLSLGMSLFLLFLGLADGGLVLFFSFFDVFQNLSLHPTLHSR